VVMDGSSCRHTAAQAIHTPKVKSNRASTSMQGCATSAHSLQKLTTAVRQRAPY
jgi:hypothetical protein